MIDLEKLKEEHQWLPMLLLIILSGLTEEEKKRLEDRLIQEAEE